MRKEEERMRFGVATVVSLMVSAGGLAACGGPGSTDDKGRSSLATTSKSVQQHGEKSVIFEGDGVADGGASKSADLYGQYSVKWEFSGNVAEDAESPVSFISEIGGSRSSPIVSETAVSGSGTAKVIVEQWGSYYPSVYGSPKAHWKFTFNRTCAHLFESKCE